MGKSKKRQKKEKEERKRSKNQKNVAKKFFAFFTLSGLWLAWKDGWIEWLEYDPIPDLEENPHWIIFDIASWMVGLAICQYFVGSFAIQRTNECRPNINKIVMPKHCIVPQPPPNITDYLERHGLFMMTAHNGFSGWIEGNVLNETAINTPPPLEPVAVVKRNQVEEVVTTPYYLTIGEFCPKNRALVHVAITAHQEQDACIDFEYAMFDKGRVFERARYAGLRGFLLHLSRSIQYAVVL